MPSKIPSKLKIGGFEWRIERDRNVLAEDEAYASTHFRSQKIFLVPDGTSTEQHELTCLIHELLHVLLWQSGMVTRLGDDKLEEEIVTSLAHGLYQALKENRVLNVGTN
jgi:hypothetical protein